MTMTKHVPETFLKSFMVEIAEFNHVYSLSAYDASSGTALKAEDWVPFLYFRYERGFFGLTANTTEDSILVSPLEMIELFSPKQLHNRACIMRLFITETVMFGIWEKL